MKVVSVDFSYPYFGEPGNTCQRGSVFVHAIVKSKDGGPRTPVVVRMLDSAGLTPGTDTVLDDVRRAGTGRDGTAVYCSPGRLAAAIQPVAVDAPPPLVAAEVPAETASPPAQSARASRCTSRVFNIVKKSLADKKFGPSEFDPESALDAPEPVDCGLARSRVTNVLLLRMVKDGSSKPETVVGAEWGSSTWQRDADAQRRAVKVYLVESSEDATAQR